jgi:ABC-type transport system involved in multi-copper enzyme maturation permease subunit
MLVAAGIAAAVAGVGEFAARLLVAQGVPAAGGVLRAGAALAVAAVLFHALFTQATTAAPAATAIELAFLLGGGLLAEAAARLLAPAVGAAAQVAAGAAAVWWTRKVFAAAPRHRFAATTVAAVAALASLVWFAWRREWFGTALALGGMTLMGCGFLAGLAALRGLLALPGGVTAVARTMLDEAIRMRVALVLVILLLVSLPLLPLLLDPGERLEYRVQFLISWALGGTGLILGVLTVLLASGSVCGDIDGNRIHMTLTKPITRFEYLAGKWLGLVLLDLLLVALAGAGVYTFVRLLARMPAGAEDRRALDDQVLTARRGVLPEHPRGAAFSADIDAEIDRLRRDNPDFFRTGDRARARGRIRQELVWQWHTVTADTEGEFLFRDLGAARRRGGTVQLQLKPHADNVSLDRADVSFALWLNDRPYPVVDGRHEPYTLASRTLHTIPLPAAEIDDGGTLRIRIANRNAIPPGEKVPTSINFSPGRGLQVLYAAGGFEANYLRALVEMWLKLVTIAAVGVAAACCLGFPVAALLGLMTFLAASGGGFLGNAVDVYTGLDAADATLGAMLRLRLGVFQDFVGQGEIWEAAKVVLAVLGELFLAVVPSFARFDGVTSLATGMRIGTGNLVECLLRLGLVAPLAIGGLGWALFERRDLVRSNS